MAVEAVNSILTLLIMIGMGFWIAGKPWFGKQGGNVLSKLAVQIIIPCYMCYNVLTTCPSRESLWELLRQTPVPILTILANLALGIFLTWLLRVAGERKGVFINVITFTNTVIVGFPVVEAIYGAEALPRAMIYYMGNTVLFWTLGVWLLRRDGAAEIEKPSLLKRAARFLPPPMAGFLAGVFLAAVEAPLPDFLMETLAMMKGATTPLCMFFIGSIIRNSSRNRLFLSKDMLFVILVRFIITPAAMLLICFLLPADGQTKQIFFLMASMPAMTQLGIMAKECGSDYEFAAAAVTLTTLISMFVIPVYVFLTGMLFP